MTSAINKNNEYFDMVKSDHDKVNSKYDDIFNYANSDVTKSDEYQSAYDNIMPSYTLAAMQGRKSQTASGAASNGGNVDSFSAANALRQQAALTAKGQQLAHQAGLEAYQARIQNARNILSDLGVYNSGVYSAMSDSIGHDRTTANDIISNEETAKNNDVARKSEIASVTGYTPDEWVVSNNPYMNEDGTIKEQYKDVDFSEVMAKAKAAGNTVAYNAAATARYYKIMSNYGLYGQYDDGNYNLPTQQQTEAARRFDEQIAAADRALGVEREMGAAENQNKLDQITTAALYSTDTVDNLPKVSSKSTGSQSTGGKSSTTGNTANAKTQSYDLLGDDSDADGRNTSELYELAAKDINAYLNELYGHKKADVNYIFDTDGTYRFTDNNEATTENVVWAVLKKCNYMSDEEKYIFLRSLGISDEQIGYVAEDYAKRS